MIPPAAAPPSVPIPAPFSRVLNDPPEHPAAMIDNAITAAVINLGELFIVIFLDPCCLDLIRVSIHRF